MLKRELFRSVGGFDADLRCAQHTELAIRLLANNVTIHNIEEPLITIHVYGNDRIRGNPDRLFAGTLRFLEKHKNVLADDSIMLANFYSILGVNAFRIGRYDECKRALWLAAKTDPFRPIRWARVAVSMSPRVARRVWT